MEHFIQKPGDPKPNTRKYAIFDIAPIYGPSISIHVINRASTDSLATPTHVIINIASTGMPFNILSRVREKEPIFFTLFQTEL